MPLVFDNLTGRAEKSSCFGAGWRDSYFVHCGERPTPNPEGIGNLHHIAFTVSRATYTQVTARLDELGIKNTGPIDRGFMDSIYFRDPNGQLLEMACFKFVPPQGCTIADVLSVAHRLRLESGDYNITDKHLADAIAELAGQKVPVL
jgi:hypothetical protein